MDLKLPSAKYQTFFVPAPKSSFCLMACHLRGICKLQKMENFHSEKHDRKLYLFDFQSIFPLNETIFIFSLILTDSPYVLFPDVWLTNHWYENIKHIISIIDSCQTIHTTSLVDLAVYSYANIASE